MRLRYPSLGESRQKTKFVGNDRQVQASKQSKERSPWHPSLPTNKHTSTCKSTRSAESSRLRQARDWFFANCFADTLDEAMHIAPPGTEAGTNFMMVISYWDQACALLNYGLLHEDLFFETSGEFFGVWNRIRPTIQGGPETVLEQTLCRPHRKSSKPLRILG